MMSTVVNNQSSAALPEATSSSAPASSTSNLASEETFLKLFVSQLQNQDPLNPNEQDPTQMVSELAQFSQLEQMVNINSNVQSIKTAISGGTSQTAAGS
jgi:flagellar basal-body rod modification protein FlgD